MRDILIVFVHLIVTVVRLIRPGGLCAVIAESMLTGHQILIVNRSRKRATNLRVPGRIIVGLCALLMRPFRLLCCRMVPKPSTRLHFHHVLTKRKYRMLWPSAWAIDKDVVRRILGTHYRPESRTTMRCISSTNRRPTFDY